MVDKTCLPPFITKCETALTVTIVSWSGVNIYDKCVMVPNKSDVYYTLCVMFIVSVFVFEMTEKCKLEFYPDVDARNQK